MPEDSAQSRPQAVHQRTCRRCGSVLDPGEDSEFGEERLTYMELYGEWGGDRNGFADAPDVRTYCFECQQKRTRDAAAYYEVEDRDRLWSILEAADGRLVADCGPIFIGGKPWIRVVGGELEGMKAASHVDEESKTIYFTSEPADVSRDWFESVFRAESEHPDDHPTKVLLKPVDETPFSDQPMDPDQATLQEVEEQ